MSDTVKTTAIYESENHKFFFLGWEEKEEGGVVQTNQYFVIDENEGTLLDPGGVHVFPRVLANVSEILDIAKIKHIFFSHQDPDVSSGVSLWLSAAQNAKVHISGLWTRFLPHFGVYDLSRIEPIPDKGGEIRLPSGKSFILIPAHFLHSPGQFNLYDPVSKILFSGDIGAAVFPEGKRYPFVEDFEEHKKFMEGFHKRYMASGQFCKKWVETVRKYDVQIIAPQHGAIFRGENVKKFLDWLYNLKCGSDFIDELYGR